MHKQENILDNPHFKDNPFIVPEDYFETTYLRVSEKILSSQYQSPFAIPEDYFETNALKLSGKILTLEQQDNNNILQKDLSSNNKYQRKIIYFNIVKYIAAAASIIGVIWGVYVYYMSEPHVRNDIIQKPCQTIACLTKQDILSREILDDEIIEAAVSDEALDEYLNQNNSLSKDTNSSLINEAF